VQGTGITGVTGESGSTGGTGQGGVTRIRGATVPTNPSEAVYTLNCPTTEGEWVVTGGGWTVNNFSTVPEVKENAAISNTQWRIRVLVAQAGSEMSGWILCIKR
jgi:hypothetical protein